MIIIMEPRATEAQCQKVIDTLKENGFDIRFKKHTNKYETAADMGKANSEMKELRKTIARARRSLTQDIRSHQYSFTSSMLQQKTLQRLRHSLLQRLRR